MIRTEFEAQAQRSGGLCGLHICSLFSTGEAGQDSGEGHEFQSQTRYGFYGSPVMGLWASWFISLALSSLCLKRKKIIALTSQGSFYGLNKVMYTNSFAFRKNSIKISCNYQALVLSLKVYLHLPWSWFSILIDILILFYGFCSCGKLPQILCGLGWVINK